MRKPRGLADTAKALLPLGIDLSVPSPRETISARQRPLLVGREREQTILKTQLDRMLAGQGGTILVGGDAGIGKTTLVEDLSVHAEASGVLVLWGHAYDLSVTPPYGPWLKILGNSIGVQLLTCHRCRPLSSTSRNWRRSARRRPCLRKSPIFSGVPLRNVRFSSCSMTSIGRIRQRLTFSACLRARYPASGSCYWPPIVLINCTVAILSNAAPSWSVKPEPSDLTCGSSTKTATER